ncbi:MAG TPA: Gfo/Idh/MocA family oxidoreductase [Chloroflexota bacterium]|nr:Gfo/Idh/MocA family oxidoreductase [Chloroflexota bacterium]
MKATRRNGPVRVAVVGCGEISRAHLRAIQANEPSLVEVAGVFDQSAERARARATEFSVERIYDSWEDVRGQSDIDVVALLLPHDVHARFTIEALEAGHHVVVEKPMGTSIDECDQMIESALKAGKQLRPVHNRIYDPGTDAVKEFIQGGAIGEVFLAQTLGLEPPRTVSVRPWLGTKAGGGGVLLAQAVHPAYILRTVLGEVSEVTCITSQRKVVDMTAEDTAVAIYRFESGALAEMTGTFGLPIGPHEHRITFYGPDGFVEISSARGINALSEKRYGDRSQHALLEDPEWGTGFRRLWTDYAHGFAEGTPTRVTAEDGKRAVEMILGAYKSAEERRTVTLPL